MCEQKVSLYSWQRALRKPLMLRG